MSGPSISPTTVAMTEARSVRAAVGLLRVLVGGVHEGPDDAATLAAAFRRGINAKGGVPAIRDSLSKEEAPLWLRLTESVDDVVLYAKPSRRQGPRGDLHFAITCLRVSRNCRALAEVLGAPADDSWNLIPFQSPRWNQLSNAVKATEELLRGLVEEAHDSPQTLGAYLKSSPILGSMKGPTPRPDRLDKLTLGQMGAILTDDYHSRRVLAPVFQFEGVLDFRDTVVRTMREFLADLSNLRNRLDHIRTRSVGEESLLLHSLEAEQIVRPVQRAMLAGYLHRTHVKESVLPGLLSQAPEDAADLLSPARGVPEPPRQHMTAEWPAGARELEALRSLQSQLARQLEGGLWEREELVGGRSMLFVLVPNETGSGKRAFHLSKHSLALADGELADARQVARFIHAAAKEGRSGRLPNPEELAWALAPHAGPERSNAFRLQPAEHGSAYWVDGNGGLPHLVRLPLGVPDTRLQGHLRWLLD